MPFFKATKLETLKEKQKMRFELGGTRVLLVYLEDKVYAMNDRCPHMRASLYEGTIDEEGIVTCPKHNAKINVKTGEVVEKARVMFIKMPTSKAFTYRVKVENAMIYVNIV